MRMLVSYQLFSRHCVYDRCWQFLNIISRNQSHSCIVSNFCIAPNWRFVPMLRFYMHSADVTSNRKNKQRRRFPYSWQVDLFMFNTRLGFLHAACDYRVTQTGIRCSYMSSKRARSVAPTARVILKRSSNRGWTRCRLCERRSFC